jgi:hypothetical protein
MDMQPHWNSSGHRGPEHLLEHWLSEQNHAWATGHPILIETLVRYHWSDPSAEDSDWLLSLICNEVALREGQGDRPSLEEYQRRFPKLHQSLILQWEINRLLETGDMQGATTLKGVEPREDGKPPSQVGRYEILRVLGRGAMGIVYEVWDPKLKRSVALKRLRAGWDADVGEIASHANRSRSRRSFDPSQLGSNLRHRRRGWTPLPGHGVLPRRDLGRLPEQPAA